MSIKHKTINGIESFTTKIKEMFEDVKTIYVVFEPKNVSKPDKFETVKIDLIGLIIQLKEIIKKIEHKELFEIFGQRIIIWFKESELNPNKQLNLKQRLGVMMIDATTVKTYNNSQYYYWVLQDISKKARLAEEMIDSKNEFMENYNKKFLFDELAMDSL